MVNKIIKTHSVNNGYVKNTLTLSTEENSATNKAQTPQYNHSPAFHGPNAPAAYGFWDDFGKELLNFGNGIVKGITRPDKVISELLGAPTAESTNTPDITSHIEVTFF
ncbi:hypothetical protein [Wolbachia endosymbiont of Folsomia candida]|uniref:hypothetical protein n=1 Tax=Wolbachia endosymbiont of Folsomia candida TaxID=169402 RepID=UPI000B60960D|nr:hypothetical protein [Wolbachia endosymbiont of Folsomia candida]APR98159.1 hypothetical protein ASM33_02495 [Wolbachia endosymbiont of Folsomia candida]